MFQKILVVTDGSKSSQQMLSKVFILAQATGGRLLLLHIMPPRASDASVFVLSELDRQKHWEAPDETFLNTCVNRKELFVERLKASRQLLHHQSSKHKVAAGIDESIESSVLNRLPTCPVAFEDVPTNLAQHSSNPGRTICDVAQICKADLIVMGLPRTPVSEVHEASFRAISDSVIHYASCPVLIVNHRAACEAA